MTEWMPNGEHANPQEKIFLDVLGVLVENTPDGMTETGIQIGYFLNLQHAYPTLPILQPYNERSGLFNRKVGFVCTMPTDNVLIAMHKESQEKESMDGVFVGLGSLLEQRLNSREPGFDFATLYKKNSQELQDLLTEHPVDQTPQVKLYKYVRGRNKDVIILTQEGFSHTEFRDTALIKLSPKDSEDPIPYEGIPLKPTHKKIEAGWLFIS
jgi:hypothetical protein